jgi:hypothetical protein
MKLMLKTLHLRTKQDMYRPNTRYGGKHENNDHRSKAGMLKTIHQAAGEVPVRKWLIVNTPEVLTWWRESKPLLKRMQSELNPPSKASGDHIWLDTNDISDKLMQFEEVYNWRFLNLEVYASHTDVTTKSICARLRKKWAIKSRYTSCAFVLNDSDRNLGSHWVCVFFNRKERCIEYFDSMGYKANRIIAGIIEKVQQCLGPNVTFENRTGPRLQQSSTECGMYALYYIKQRLLGVSRASILARGMPDTEICALREQYFTDPKPEHHGEDIEEAKEQELIMIDR